MKELLILGAGTAGTMVANKLNRELDRREWHITIVDQDETHYYQPGFLFIPFEIYQPEDVVRPVKRTVHKGIDLITSEITAIRPNVNEVQLAKDNQTLTYDYLIVATGTHPRPEETPGLGEEGWRETIHDFYTFEGAVALADRLKDWEGGKMVVNIMELPFKCPVAPLEFVFLADWYFQEKGIRDKVDITFVTPLPGAFTKPKAGAILGDILERKNINIVTDFYPEQVDTEQQLLISYDEEEVPYDLLVTVPVNLGADVVGEAGLGDDMNHVPVDPHTFLSKKYDNVFALGDAAALPTSKAGSVAHFAADVFVENFLDYIEGKEMSVKFDGHANCFIESGFNKGILIDFNYEVEPLPGKFPYAGVGPLPLLKESRLNHWGKMAFRWIYWNVLLPGREMPISTDLSMAGKWQ